MIYRFRDNRGQMAFHEAQIPTASPFLGLAFGDLLGVSPPKCEKTHARHKYTTVQYLTPIGGSAANKNVNGH